MSYDTNRSPKRRRLSPSPPDHTAPYANTQHNAYASNAPSGYAYDDEDDDDGNYPHGPSHAHTTHITHDGANDATYPSASGYRRENNPHDDHDQDEDEDDFMHTPRSHLSPTPSDSRSASRSPDSNATPPPPPREKTPREKWRPYKLKTSLPGAHRRGIAQVKFSPDGTRLASCSADATIRIFDTRRWREVHCLQAHLAGISTIAWSPDSETLASGSDDKTIRLWNTVKGKPYPTPLVGHHNYIYSIAFSPKGNIIVSGSYDEAVYLWDVRGARVMRTLPAHSDPVAGVDFAHDGTLLLSGGQDGLIRIWDTFTGQCLKTMVQEDRSPVYSVRFSPNSKFVLSSTSDSCLRLWNYIEGRCVKTYQGHKNVKYSIGSVFGTYGENRTDVFIGTGSEDGRIVMYDITSKEVLQELDAHDGVVLGLDYLPEQNWLVSGGLDGSIKVWEVDLDAPAVELSDEVEMNDEPTT